MSGEITIPPGMGEGIKQPAPTGARVREYRFPAHWLLYWLQGRGRIVWGSKQLAPLAPPVNADFLVLDALAPDACFRLALQHESWPEVAFEDVQPINLAGWNAFQFSDTRTRQLAELERHTLNPHHREIVRLDVSHVITFFSGTLVPVGDPLLSPLAMPETARPKAIPRGAESLSELAPWGPAVDAGEGRFDLLCTTKRPRRPDLAPGESAPLHIVADTSLMQFVEVPRG